MATWVCCAWNEQYVQNVSCGAGFSCLELSACVSGHLENMISSSATSLLGLLKNCLWRGKVTLSFQPGYTGRKPFCTAFSLWQFVDVGKINNHCARKRWREFMLHINAVPHLMPFLNSFGQEYPSVPSDFNVPLVHSFSRLFEGRLKNTCPGTVLSQFWRI